MAAHLGKTVRELTSQISTDELIEWQAFDILDPIGGYRHDLNTALLAKIGSGNKDSALRDFILIDPYPMTDEQREQHDQALQRDALAQSTQRMVAMFEKQTIKPIK